MNFRALLTDPIVLATVSSFLAGGPKKEPRVPSLLRKGAAAFGLIALVSGIGAGAIYLFQRYPLEEAAFLLALYMALASIVTFLASMAWNAYWARQMLNLPRRAIEKLENQTGFALNDLGELAREYPKTSAALLAVAGYLLVSKTAGGIEKILSALDTNIHEKTERDTDYEQENHDHRHRTAAGNSDHRRH